MTSGPGLLPALPCTAVKPVVPRLSKSWSSVSADTVGGAAYGLRYWTSMLSRSMVMFAPPERPENCIRLSYGRKPDTYWFSAVTAGRGPPFVPCTSPTRSTFTFDPAPICWIVTFTWLNSPLRKLAEPMGTLPVLNVVPFQCIVTLLVEPGWVWKPRPKVPAKSGFWKLSGPMPEVP